MHVCGARLQDLHGVGAGRGMARPRKWHAAHVGRDSRHDRVFVLFYIQQSHTEKAAKFLQHQICVQVFVLCS